MENFSVDAYTPAQIAQRIENVCISKATTDPLRVFILAMLAGAFIAFGAALYTLVIHDAGSVPVGLMRLLGGFVFCLGLILVVIAGAELFTGNNLLVMAFVDQKISLKQLLCNWLIVFVGNLIGALFIVFLISQSQHWLINGGAIGQKAILIANSKVNLEFMQAFWLGVLCNILVCLAVWLCFAGHSVTDKILAIIFPITAFVALGFEHSVANMYFIPAGLIAMNDASLLEQVKGLFATTDLSQLTLLNFLTRNLLPVTLGNLVGGSFFVGIVYYFLYLRKT